MTGPWTQTWPPAAAWGQSTSWLWVNGLDAQVEMDVALIWGHYVTFGGNGGPDICTDPSHGRTTDSDMVLNSVWIWISPLLQWQYGHEIPTLPSILGVCTCFDGKRYCILEKYQSSQF